MPIILPSIIIDKVPRCSLIKSGLKFVKKYASVQNWKTQFYAYLVIFPNLRQKENAFQCYQTHDNVSTIYCKFQSPVLCFGLFLVTEKIIWCQASKNREVLLYPNFWSTCSPFDILAIVEKK